jgi:protein SCO1/2
MQPFELSGASSEAEFAAYVDALDADANADVTADAARRARLIDLLREDHPVYDQRGSATVSLMRGWVLAALARAPVSDEALPFVLEELDTGVDPYLVASAARTLRSYPHPGPALTPFVMRAIEQIRYHDDPVSFDEYGEYSPSSATSPLRELFKTLAWLGLHASGVVQQVEELAQARGLGRLAKAEANLALAAIRAAAAHPEADCCELPPGFAGRFSWPRLNRRGAESIESASFEDHDGRSLTFSDAFHGHPSIVVFFYTRCDNPLKCSLTVTKLAAVQKMLAARGLADRIHTCAITYDPAFDSAKRIAMYGKDRGVRMDDRHRMLRVDGGMSAVLAHFKSGVNFIESLVNRHRVEAYVLDARGRIAASFERLLWEEQALVASAVGVLNEKERETEKEQQEQLPPQLQPPPQEQQPQQKMRAASSLIGAVASISVAFFPKCPVCWATYLSMFGVAGLDQIPLPIWLQPLLVAAMVINLASVWFRGWSTGRFTGAWLVTAGVAIILASQSVPGWERGSPWGVGLVLAGSLMCARERTQPWPSGMRLPGRLAGTQTRVVS